MISVIAVGLLSGVLPAEILEPRSDWTDDLRPKIEKIESETPGELGVYIKRVGDEKAFEFDADRPWYLASTIKVPVAIALLQKVQEGSISLDREVTLKRSDYVDGSGEVNWKEPGTRLSVRYLLEQMLKKSDSAATDILIRLIGVEDLNRRVRKMAGNDFGPITTLLGVRYEAYGELHPNARRLSNMDFFEIKKAKEPEARLAELTRLMKVKSSDLRAPDIETAFERYYERGLNSGSLVSFGKLLEKLARGELLQEKNTNYVLKLMEEMETGEKRVKAGLPSGTKFAQKTGTQVRRICNVGLARATDRPGLVIATCLEKFEDPAVAEETLKRVGEAIGLSALKM